MDRAAPRKNSFRLGPPQPVGELIPHREHGSHFHHADNHYLQAHLADSLPPYFQAYAEQQQDQAQLGQHPDGLQVLHRALNVGQGAEVNGGQSEGPDYDAGEQVAQHRRHVDSPEQHQRRTGHRHGDGKVADQADAIGGADSGQCKQGLDPVPSTRDKGDGFSGESD